MTDATFTPVVNGQAIATGEVPVLSGNAFASRIAAGALSGERVAALFGMETTDNDCLELVAVLANDATNSLALGRTVIDRTDFSSLTPFCPQVHLFEREIAEQFGTVPVGHPWLKPVRAPLAMTGSYRVSGPDVHEVAVGPVHAGIIEPGHFRFQCHGEEVLHLEIMLGYQHRGVEAALAGGPDALALRRAEAIAGDTTIGHATTYSQILEALGGCRVEPRAQALRGILLELERLANHVGDLGALAGDTGFLPTASFCGRIRGDFLNMTALVCGSRFGRGGIRPGGAGFDLEPARAEKLLALLATAERESGDAIGLLWDTQSVMARLEDTGPLPADLVRELGIVGPAARASGVARDIRADQPSGIYRFAQIPVATNSGGDVFSRAFVRWLEIQHSITFIREQLAALPAGSVLTPCAPPAPDSIAVALTEGWRGEICHVALTGHDGRFLRYKIVDPSFHNWLGLALAMRGQEISDFPLCNKSFNLSYCGHDL